jgi:RND family efflux transporter MFP subunit
MNSPRPDRAGAKALAAFVCLSAAVALVGCSKPAPIEEPVRAVRTLRIAADNVSAQLEFAAEVKARTESRVGFRVPGKLVRRHVEVGQVVRAGQLLAQLDAQDLRLGDEAANAALSAAQTQLAQAQADVQRFRELRQQGFISEAELERRESTWKAARAQAQQAQAQAAVQANQTRYASLWADVAGVVTAVDVEVGAVVAAGAPILRIAHDGPRDLVFSVPEDKVPLVNAAAAQPQGLAARFWDNARPAVPATVREVAAAADPVTRTYQVKADIGRADVRLGQTATVVLTLASRGGVLRLPSTAVSRADGRTVVWVLDEATMSVTPKPVEVGAADGQQLVIASGLSPGQEVVTAGVHTLTPGQKVRRYVEPGARAMPASSPSATAGAAAAGGTGPVQAR